MDAVWVFAGRRSRPCAIGRTGFLIVLALVLFAALLAVASPARAVDDTTPPQVVSYSLTPSQINTESSYQIVTATVHVTDDLSGVSSYNDDPSDWASVGLAVSPLVGTQRVYFSLSRISGDSLDGVYSGTAMIPMGSATGTWRVDSLQAADKSRNIVFLEAADLEARFGSGYATVTNLATVGDTTPPQVLSFSLTPYQINTESSDQTITATMHITDDLSGVNCQDNLSVPVLSLWVAQVAGPQSAQFELHRISGDDHDGVYSGTATLPMGSGVGMWRVLDLRLADKVGNWVDLNDQTLKAAVPGAEGTLFANTALTDQVTIVNYWCITTAHTTVVFQPGTVVTRAGGGVFPFYEMAAQEFTIDDSVPTTNLDGTPVAAVRVGIPGFNLSFSQPVTIALEVGVQYNGLRLNIQSLGEDATAWANETASDVASGHIQFTVNHATKFVVTLPKPSAPKPTLTKISPTAAKRGATVTLTGKNFGTKRGTSTVRFGAKISTKYVSWSATRIKVKVPAKAAFGSLKVTVKARGGTSGGKSFKVKR